MLFGGRTEAGEPLHDTWEWDGAAWRDPGLPTVPELREPRLVYDGGAGRLLLVGTQTWPEGDRRGLWVLGAEDWRRLEPTAMPAPRSGAPLVRDSARDRIVLFGGSAARVGLCGASDSTPDCRDTWEWDGSAWSRRDPPLSPGARVDHAAAYDAAQGLTVVVAGERTHADGGGADLHTDAWGWDGERWLQLQGQEPPPREGSHMVWDPVGERLVLHFGVGVVGACGLADSWYCTDMWQLDGDGWSLLGSGPLEQFPSRAHGGATWDVARGRLVLFAGTTPADSWTWDLWEWDGDVWSKHYVEGSPPPRTVVPLTYDAARGWSTAFGGEGLSQTVLRDLEAWDGRRWHNPRPYLQATGRISHGLAYDELRGELVMFGGSGRLGDGSCQTDEDPVDGMCRHTWARASHRAVNRLVVSFDLDGTAVLEPTEADPARKELHAVGIRARAGGFGHTWGTGRLDGERVPGVQVSVGALGRGGWIPLLTTDAPPEAPSELGPEEASWVTFDRGWSCGQAWCAGVGIDDWRSPDGLLHLDFAPRAAVGAAAEDGRVWLDYVELRLTFRRRPPGG